MPNKIINGKHCTILWHVDDLEISHVDKEVVEKMVERLPLTVTSGQVHVYLGMRMDYTKAVKCIISMGGYTQEMLKEAPANMKGLAETAAAKHLFVVNKGA